MPTIDELNCVIVASDEDMLPVSQNGIARRVSRSQLLAGTQTTLSISPGILGRSSPGLGPPQQITVGTGLSLTDGVLSSAARYSAASLPVAPNANLGDLVPIWQQGQDNSVSVRSLLSVPGVDISNQVVRAGVGATRQLGDWVGDAVSVEAFGARGDGATDDSAAINRAIASGRPVLFGPKTYRVDGQWNIESSTTLIGIVGMTVLRRSSQLGGAWVNISAPSFTSFGIIFDAGRIGGDSWGVLVAASCKRTSIQSCNFLNATGATLGTGLTIQARDGLAGVQSSHCIVNCDFKTNECHGVWVQAASNSVISNCQASDNGEFGICLDFNDPQFQQTVRQTSVTNCRCWNNSRGISVGNYNATNSEPPRWGLDNPDALDITVAGNICSDNLSYGIAVSGTRIRVCQNEILIKEGLVHTSSGILCNARLACLENNFVAGPGEFGIDSGGSVDTSITSNTISGCAIGINAGGSARIRIAENKLISNARAITLFNVETDGNGSNFGLASCDTWIEGNCVELGDEDGGIFLFDGPERVEILRNRFTASAGDVQNVCWAHTDSVWISGNTLNGSPVAEAGTEVSGELIRVTVPDVVDCASLAASITKVDAIFGLHQMAMIGQISFIRVLGGGQGYTQARVVIAGSGVGAVASAYLKDGEVIGVALTSGGSGYEQATTNVTVVGDGTGATLQPTVGLPVPQNRRLTLRCKSPVRFTQGHSGGMQANWTNTDITTAARSEIVLQAVDGAWQAVSFENIDYMRPGGDGSISIRSCRGDIGFNVAIAGGVRYFSESEPSGFLTYFGRGSPDGVIMAPPGSDYRNLDGGIGTTLWIKRVGADSIGWFAVA